MGLMHFHQAIYAEGPATEKSPTRFINLGIYGARLASVVTPRANEHHVNLRMRNFTINLRIRWVLKFTKIYIAAQKIHVCCGALDFCNRI